MSQKTISQSFAHAPYHISPVKSTTQQQQTLHIIITKKVKVAAICNEEQICLGIINIVQWIEKHCMQSQMNMNSCFFVLVGFLLVHVVVVSPLHLPFFCFKYRGPLQLLHSLKFSFNSVVFQQICAITIIIMFPV